MATCENCSNAVPESKRLCLSCRRRESVDDSLSSPDVAADGSIDHGPKETVTVEGGSSGFSPSLPPLSILALKAKGLGVLAFNMALIAGFVVGSYLVIAGTRMGPTVFSVELLGVEWTPMVVAEIALATNEVVMLAGAAVCLISLTFFFVVNKLQPSPHAVV